VVLHAFHCLYTAISTLMSTGLYSDGIIVLNVVTSSPEVARSIVVCLFAYLKNHTADLH